MRFLILLATTAVLTAAASVLSPAASAQTTQGDFRASDDSHIRIYNCGSEVCARLIQLPPNLPTNLDTRNPDASLHSRPLCGLVIGSGFHQDDPAHLSGGRLYDPKSGHTYRGTITAQGDTLKLHGYIGVSFLGRTDIWKRVPAISACH